jgi:hypothetical protein
MEVGMSKQCRWWFAGAGVACAIVLVLASLGLGVYRVIAEMLGVSSHAVSMKDAVLVAAAVVFFWYVVLFAPRDAAAKPARED